MLIAEGTDGEIKSEILRLLNIEKEAFLFEVWFDQFNQLVSKCADFNNKNSIQHSEVVVVQKTFAKQMNQVMGLEVEKVKHSK